MLYQSVEKVQYKLGFFLNKVIEGVMKMIVKGRENRDQLEVFSIEEFVPTDHLLRKNRQRGRLQPYL